MNFDKVWKDLREQRKRESFMLEEWQIDATVFFWVQRKLNTVRRPLTENEIVMVDL